MSQLVWFCNCIILHCKGLIAPSLNYKCIECWQYDIKDILLEILDVNQARCFVPSGGLWRGVLWIQGSLAAWWDLQQEKNQRSKPKSKQTNKKLGLLFVKKSGESGRPGRPWIWTWYIIKAVFNFFLKHVYIYVLFVCMLPSTHGVQRTTCLAAFSPSSI